MAGTLTISTLSDGTNSTSSTNCIQGSAKAWVNFNGSGSATIRASYNVSSVVRNGTGDYTVNFTNALTDANYTVSGVQDFSYCSVMVIASGTQAPTSSAVRVFTKNNSFAATDSGYVFVAINR